MILRLSSPAARVLLALLASMLAAALSYSGIRNALAVHDAELNTLEGYERAIRLEADDATNWYLLGRYWQYTLEDPDAQRAMRAYRAAWSRPPIAWTDDVRGTQPGTQVELPGTSGNDVRELHLGVSRLPSAKLPGKIGGSAWIDDVSLVPQSAENTKQ